MIIKFSYLLIGFFLLHTTCVAETSEQQSIELSSSFSSRTTVAESFIILKNDPDGIEKIFNRVLSAANVLTYRPKLAMTKAPENEDMTKLSPQALPDGSVIISDKVIDLAKKLSKGNTELFEAFMAFIVGHELAHLAHNDFERGRSVLKKLAGSEKYARSDKKPTLPPEIRKEFELQADKTGFMYAMFAGYKVGLLVNDNHIIKLLTEFFDSKNTETVKIYPDPKVRAVEIRVVWDELYQKYTFYEYGVRLAIFDQCRDAIAYFFDEFQRAYQGKEIQNNLGVCYLQLAKADMGDAAYFYWLPWILDGDIESIITMGSTITNLQNLRSARLIERVKGNLEAAIHHFKLSIHIAPNYIPSYLNIAISYLYLGEPNLANLYLNEGLEQYRKQNAQDQTFEIWFKMLTAIAQYENTQISSVPFQAVINDLRQILNEYKNPPLQVTFNLARLLDVAGRNAEAQDLWNQLAQDTNRTRLPKPILEIVCTEQQGTSCNKSIIEPPQKTKSWSKPTIWQGKRSYQILDALRTGENQWKRRLHEVWYKMLVSIYQSQDGQWEGLFFDGYPILLINREPNETHDSLKQYCSEQLRKKTLVETEVYLCENWAAKVIDNKVVEVWIQM